MELPITKDLNSIKALLKRTDWQSWTGGFKKLPRFNFPPYTYDYFVKLPTVLKKKPSIKGWSSWSYYGTSINEEVIQKQLNWLQAHKDLNLEYILIDDGWTTWGDWDTVNMEKFPNGLASLNKEINNKGFKGGIWISPFLVDPKSRLVKDHPEWLVYSKKGSLVDGLNITGFSITPSKKYLLNIENPEVVSHLNNIFSILFNKYGFNLVKLDFLYSIYFDPSRSPEESDKLLHRFLSELKQQYPNIYTIACGCPLAPAIGTVDSFRIYIDNFIFSYLPPKLRFIVNIFKTLYANFYIKGLSVNYKDRLWTSGFWNLDLDSFICHKDFGFSEKKITKLRKLIKDSKGNIFLGDDLTTLSKVQLENHIKKLLS